LSEERELKKDRQEKEVLYGVHPVMEAMQSESRRIEKIFIYSRARGMRISQLVKTARSRGIPVVHIPAATLKKMAGTEKHQGMIAVMASAAYSSREEIFSMLDEKSIVLILDRVEDPGNLGAITRTAAAMGVSAIFLSAKGSAGLTSAAAKRSAGALEWIRIARSKNLVSLLKEFKKKGFYIAAVEKGGVTKSYEAIFQFPLVIIMGGEHLGIRKELMDQADLVVEIPIRKRVKSLNVSVACGMILYEVMRAKRVDRGIVSIH
jgi:23S rRNA (guanosine2251-2'-O)-methyltransferase